MSRQMNNYFPFIQGPLTPEYSVEYHTKLTITTGAQTLQL